MTRKKIMMTFISLLCFGAASFSQQFEIGHHGKHAGGLGAPLLPADYANYSSITFENGWLLYGFAGTIIDPATADANIHVFVVDELGNLIWETEYGNAGDQEVALDLVYDSGNDYLVITGMVNEEMLVANLNAFSGAIMNDTILTGFDPSGTDFSAGTNIICNQSGNYIVGGFYTTVNPNGGLTSSEAVILEMDPNLNVSQTIAFSQSGMPNGNDCTINDILEIDGLGYFITGSYQSSSPTNEIGVLAVFLDQASLTPTTDLSFYDPNGADCRGVSAIYDAGMDQISLLSNHDATGNAELRTIIDVMGTPMINFTSDLRLDMGGVPFRGSGFQIMECPWDPGNLIIAGRSIFALTGGENKTWLLEMEKGSHTFINGILWEIAPYAAVGYQNLATPGVGDLLTYDAASPIHPTIYNSEIITPRWDNMGVVALSPTDIAGFFNFGIDIFATEFMTANGCFEPINCSITDVPETFDPIRDNGLAPTGSSNFSSNTVATGVDDVCFNSFAPIQSEGDNHLEGSGLASVTEETGNAVALEILPNPSSGEFRVSISNATTGYFTVTNIQGQEVYRSAQISGTNYTEMVDLNHLENGIYLLRFMEGETQLIEKMIKF